MRIIPRNGRTVVELCEELGPVGVELGVARRIQAAAVAHRRPGLIGVRGLRRKVRERLEEMTWFPRLKVLRRERDPGDGFVKYLFELADGHLVEAVRIPLEAPRYSVCVSSQVGCALRCDFCATGRLGLGRNLEAWEMVEQVLTIRDEADLPVTGAVFMGMGEPFLNYDEVIRACRILSSPSGGAVSGKAITISTAGVTPAIRRYTREGHPYRLAISLHAATSAKRAERIPHESRWPLRDLMEAVREHQRSIGDRVMLEWTMISGWNCGEDDARALAELVGDTPVRFNIIDVNDPSGRDRPPTARELSRFRDALGRWLGQPVVRRYSGGRSIDAACGTLAASAASAARP